MKNFILNFNGKDIPPDDYPKPFCTFDMTIKEGEYLLKLIEEGKITNSKIHKKIKNIVITDLKLGYDWELRYIMNQSK